MGILMLWNDVEKMKRSSKALIWIPVNDKCAVLGNGRCLICCVVHRATKTQFSVDAMRLLMGLWKILFHSSRSTTSKSRTVNGGVGLAAMRCLSVTQTCSMGFNSEEHAGLYNHFMPLFQAYLLQIELYEVQHYHTLKERNHQRLQRKTRHVARASHLHNFGLLNCRSVHPLMLIPAQTINPPRLYCDIFCTSGGLFRVPLSSYTRIRWVSHSRLNWYTSNEKHLTPLPLHPISMFNNPSISGRMVC